MKYEITQGQYADFLNTLSLQTIPPRAKFMFGDYEYFRGSITLSDKRFVATSPDRPANFVSWDDGMAYADWAGLRPMTELEFEKAARGTVVPKPKDYPWGSSSIDNLKRFVNENNEVVWAGLLEKDLTDENRDLFGASFYWVMDLSGSIWERCITIGSEAGRNFKGTHGDGATNYGYATNEDWPAGDHKSSGFGFRGGGFYEHGLSSDVHVPFSPVAFRRYGAWAGGYATQAYGQRFVRSVR
ncbi:MAG TPA: SUMF1/EgtB/PvdO family nonheme iron enzyme [Chryseosolibacter sp.]|nr:SUMF1/EgtB/PvdO family nonheme iron enzyme [Chryseosolibacter sp.]